MRFNYRPTTGTFTLMGLTESQMIQLHNDTTDAHLKASIQDALFDLIDSTNIEHSVNISPRNFWKAKGLNIQ